MEHWIGVFRDFGVPVGILVAMGLALWRGVIWLGSNIIKPVAERHIKFLDDLTMATAAQSQALQTMTMQQSKNLEGMEAIMGRMEDLIQKHDLLLTTVADVKTQVSRMDVHSDRVVIHHREEESGKK